MSFAAERLAFAEVNMQEQDKIFWRGEAERTANTVAPIEFSDNQIDDWLNQSDYANQF